MSTERELSLLGETFKGCYNSRDKNDYFCKDSAGNIITDETVLRNNFSIAKRYLYFTIPKYDPTADWWEVAKEFKYSKSASVDYENYFKNLGSSILPLWFTGKEIYISYYNRKNEEDSQDEHPFPFCISTDFRANGDILGWVSREFIEYFINLNDGMVGGELILSGGLQIYNKNTKTWNNATPYIYKENEGWKKLTPYIFKIDDNGIGHWIKGIKK